MRRLFWLGLGLAAGALAVRRLTRTAEAYTPQAVAQSLQGGVTGVLDSLREFVDDVREGMAEHEEALHRALTSDQGLTGAPAVERAEGQPAR